VLADSIGLVGKCPFSYVSKNFSLK